MTPEELLKPRIKIIAIWPGCTYAVGDILHQVHATLSKFVKDGDDQQFQFIQYPEYYTANIKPLSWWEDREEKDMPDYIRLNEECFVRVAKHHCIAHNEFQAHGTKYNYKYSICSPATKEEYEQFKSASSTGK